MSQPFCTGPALIYPCVGGGSAKQPVFFGTTEDSPRVLINREWHPLRNALAGGMVADPTFQGEHAIVRADMTRWNENVFAAMQTPPGSAVRGHMPFGSLGTFMKSEGFAYPLVVRFPYRGTKVAMNNMPAGYKFTAAWLGGPDDLGDLSTKPRKISITWICQAIMNKDLSWTLYTHDLGNLPAID